MTAAEIDGLADEVLPAVLDKLAELDPHLFGIYMRDWRWEHRVSVRTAARAAGVSRSTWSAVECGDASPTLKTAVAMYRVTKLPKLGAKMRRQPFSMRDRKVAVDTP